jgi:hypothetical protein
VAYVIDLQAIDPTISEPVARAIYFAEFRRCMHNTRKKRLPVRIPLAQWFSRWLRNGLAQFRETPAMLT